MKPQPIAFRCPRCDKRWDNPSAVDPVVGYVSIHNQSEPRLCATCSDRRAKRAELTRLTEDAGGYEAEERAYREAAEYLYPADLTDRCMRVLDAGKQTEGFPKARDWKTPVTADEYRADLEQLSGGETFRQAIERMYPGMLKDKP